VEILSFDLDICHHKKDVVNFLFFLFKIVKWKEKRMKENLMLLWGLSLIVQKISASNNHHFKY